MDTDLIVDDINNLLDEAAEPLSTDDAISLVEGVIDHARSRLQALLDDKARAEAGPYRELTDSEQAAEDATWD